MTVREAMVMYPSTYLIIGLGVGFMLGCFFCALMSRYYARQHMGDKERRKDIGGSNENKPYHKLYTFDPSSLAVESRVPRAIGDRVSDPVYLQRAIGAWLNIEYLRATEGESVEILCDNPDGFSGVSVVGSRTQWKYRMVSGETIFEALDKATRWKHEHIRDAVAGKPA